MLFRDSFFVVFEKYTFFLFLLMSGGFEPVLTVLTYKLPKFN